MREPQTLLREGARIVVLVPNWLGDAVMAIPVLHELGRNVPGVSLIVAARVPVAPLFRFVEGVQRIVTLGTPGQTRASSWDPGRGRRASEPVNQSRSPQSPQRAQSGKHWLFSVFSVCSLVSVGSLFTRSLAGPIADGDVLALRSIGADAALLLPNSFRAAWLAWRASVPERWGYVRGLRGPLLSRGIRPPRQDLHQAEYYLELIRQLGIPTGPARPTIKVDDTTRATGRELLRRSGWDTVAPLVGIAPGAAYGSAKRWPAKHVAGFVERVHADTDATCVLFGSAGDAEIAQAIQRHLSIAKQPINLVGRTDLSQFVGTAAWCRAFVSNDSGAMHVAAAIGLPVVAIFGPTKERATGPLAATVEALDPIVLTNPVWCRPCMLRRCPIDHRCMTRITPDRVFDGLMALLNR